MKIAMPLLAVRAPALFAVTTVAFVLLTQLASDGARACDFSPPIIVSIDDQDSLECLTWSTAESFVNTADVTLMNGCVHAVEVDVPCVPGTTDDTCGIQKLAPTASKTFPANAPATITWSAVDASGAVTLSAEEGTVESNPCPLLGCSAGGETPSNGLLMLLAFVGLAAWSRRRVFDVERS